MSFLGVVLEFFQNNFRSNRHTALTDFLKAQGITSQDAIEAFGVGFANAGLTKVFPKEKFLELQELGLVDANGRNRFQSTLVFPLTDESGKLADIAGTNIGLNKSIKTLTPLGKGIGNRAVLQATKEVYATNYPLLALKIFAAGFRNVIFVPDAHACLTFEADKVIYVSYKQNQEMVDALQAKEVWVATVNGKHAELSESLSKAKLVREQPIANPVENGSRIDSPDFLDCMIRDLDQLGYVGECQAKKLLYLVAISRKLKQPLSAIIISSSASGKSSLMKAILQLVPEEERLFLSRITPQALYSGLNGLSGKVIATDERTGSVGADYSLREIQSNQKLTLATAKKKKEDSGIETVEASCAYMESTTSEKINPENLNRSLVIRLKEDASTTNIILEKQRERWADNGKLADIEKEILERHHEHQKSLKAIAVLIPFAKQINFPTRKTAYRRAQEIFLRLIASHALLNQHQREQNEFGIQANIEDYKVAYDLYLPLLKHLDGELSGKALELLEQLKMYPKNKKFTLREILTLTGWSYGSVFGKIKELERYEYLESDHNLVGKKKTFQLTDFALLNINSGVHILSKPEEVRGSETNVP